MSAARLENHAATCDLLHRRSGTFFFANPSTSVLQNLPLHRPIEEIDAILFPFGPPCPPPLEKMPTFQILAEAFGKRGIRAGSLIETLYCV